MRPPPLPHHGSGTAGPWSYVIHAEQGGRPRMEDAWAVVPGGTYRDQLVDAFAVFDGLGGMPNGQAAAWGAAAALPDAMAAATDGRDLLRRLNAAAAQAEGSTTATVLILPRAAPAECVSIGDSSLFVHDAARPGHPKRLNDHERASRHRLTGWLGRTGRGGQVLPVDPGDRFMLMTDGADEEAAPGSIDVLWAAAAAETGPAVERFFAATRAHGMPDNATLLTVRREIGNE